MNVCERVSMFDGFAPPYTLGQWVNFCPHPTGGKNAFVEDLTAAFKDDSMVRTGVRLEALGSVHNLTNRNRVHYGPMET